MDLRVGLIGMGVMGARHHRVLSELPGVSLVGVVDPRISARETPLTISSVELLLRQGIDYAVVATPTSTHEEVCLALARAGIPTLIEKPLAMSSQAAQRIAAEFGRSGVIAGVGHVERYNASVRAAAIRIADGQLGDILAISTRRQGPFPGRISDVGVVLDLLTHDIDVAMVLSNSQFSSVCAVSSMPRGSEFEDVVQVTGSMDSGALVTLRADWISPFKMRRIEVLGTRGAFVIDTLTSDITFYANGDEKPQWSEMQLFRGTQLGDVTKYAIERPEPLRIEHEVFRDAVRNMDDSDLATLAQGVRVVGVADAVLQSARSGEFVSFDANLVPTSKAVDN